MADVKRNGIFITTVEEVSSPLPSHLTAVTGQPRQSDFHNVVNDDNTSTNLITTAKDTGISDKRVTEEHNEKTSRVDIGSWRRKRGRGGTG